MIGKKNQSLSHHRGQGRPVQLRRRDCILDTKKLKHLRLEARDVKTEWRRLLKNCIFLLLDHDQDDEAFRLSEKYGDYDTMKALQVNSDKLNTFMENSIGIRDTGSTMFPF